MSTEKEGTEMSTEKEGTEMSTEKETVLAFQKAFKTALKKHGKCWDRLYKACTYTNMDDLIYDHLEVERAFDTLLDVARIMDKTKKALK